MSSEMPCDATTSRSFERPSTDHASSTFADGRPLQMLFTPKAAQARRMASEWPCCVPTFIFAFGDIAARLAGVLPTCADTTASASAPTDIPLPASRTNSRRFMEPPDAACSTTPGYPHARYTTSIFLQRSCHHDHIAGATMV